MRTLEKKAETLRILRVAMDGVGEGQDVGSVPDAGTLPLGVAALDQALKGGLALGALHEIAPAGPAHMGAASGFALALASLAQKPKRQTLWIQQDFATLEGGGLYAPGLALCGVPVEQFLLLRVAKPMEALWAMEEALSCTALTSVVMEMANGHAADLTATRRLQLAARESDTLALLLRQGVSAEASAATTRWEISALPGSDDEFGGMGKPRFELNLTRNRQGPCGRWAIIWDRHERRFYTDALPLAVVSAPRNGSDFAPARRAL